MPDLINQGMEGFAVLIFAFLIIHAVADFALQNEFIARSKVRGADLSDLFGGGQPPKGIWAYSLSAHSLIHAGGVWLISGSVIFGVTEFVLHWMIDFTKGNRCFNFHIDQFLHILCKIIYAIILTT